MKYSSSFTIIELVCTVAMVIVITSIAGIIYYPKSMILSNELVHLEWVIRLSQYRALATGVDQKIIIDACACVYKYPALHNGYIVHHLPDDIVFGYPEHALGPPSKQRYPIKEAITFQREQHNHIVWCYAQGGTNAGTIYLKMKRGVSSGAVSCSVAGDRAIKVYFYEQNSWVPLKSYDCVMV